jgi:hypothetical protein
MRLTRQIKEASLSLRIHFLDHVIVGQLGAGLFSELVYNFQSERWNEFELPKLSLRELQAFETSWMPSYGTKETLVVRLLAQRERFKLARFTDNPDELASSYRRESLRDMCSGKPVFGARATSALFRQAFSICAIGAEREDRRS